MLTTRLALSALIALVIAACSDATPSPPPSAAPSPTPIGIEHATGARDVLLRVETGGGFVPPSFLATQAPFFTLYGDGTAIFRDPTAEGPPPEGTVGRLTPFRTAKLLEDEVQALLRYAIAQGGLGIARSEYRQDMIADAATTTFVLDAGGLQKRVAVYALEFDDTGGPDGPARAAFVALSDRLRTFGQDGAVAVATYEPERYRGVLMEPFGVPGGVRPWPWANIAPDEFVPGQGPGASSFPQRTLSPDDVAAIGLGDLKGGAQGIFLIGPEDTDMYELALRPLLPDEAA